MFPHSQSGVCPHPSPAALQDADAIDHVFTKHGHQGVYIESRRNNGVWEFLGIDTDAPYDERSLLVPNTAETREYRMCFWDKGTPNGDWTPVQKVAVGA